MKPIAIIGMSAIFPQADSLGDYWENIMNEVDCITDVPASRWSSADYFDPDPSAPDKTYCKRGGFINDIDFDPVEFGLPPNILEVTDVSQLLGLVAAKACLEDGGYGDARGVSREKMGVILGIVGVGSKLMIPLTSRLQYPVWERVLKSYGIAEPDRLAIIEKIKLAYPKWEENSFPGAIGNVVAGRIANRFDMGGTNCVVDAACASSLAALHMAIGELESGRADMMISGGVDTDNSIGTFLCFSKTPAFTKSDRVRTFDKDSDGMMAGEGIGMLLLKRLEDAQKDGDRVYAVIKGIGTASDGRYKSIYAPRPAGQALALRRAYTDAGFSPATVGLIEAHGTGTMAGDPAEFQGLSEVFSEVDSEKQHIALGSVKSQIAHTKAAAGAASLIKIALALHNKVLPATINVQEPNPKFGIETTPFYLNTRVRPWIAPQGHPRRAGVSSFGFGGTNFHIVLEEAVSEHSGPYRTLPGAKVILLAASDPASLAAECQTWLGRLAGEDPIVSFSELAALSAESLPPSGSARIGFSAADAAEAAAKLKTAADLVKTSAEKESSEHPSGVYYRRSGLDTKGNVVALFPGQGSQYVNMGADTAMTFPEIRQAFARADALFAKEGQPTLTRTVFPNPAFDSAEADGQQRKLTATEFAQPAIGTLSAGYFNLLRGAGFKPDFAAGHSFGELTALWAAGVLSDADFYNLAKARGKAMAPPADAGFDAGTMLAVKAEAGKIRADIQDFPEVVLANINSSTQTVLAGPRAAITKVQKALTDKGYAVTPLDVSAAFHTPLVGHAQKPFAEAVARAKFKKPKMPVFSNSTGKQYPADPAKIQKILSDHILNPVNFRDEIEAIYAAGGSVFVEVGPKSVLTNLVNTILEGQPHTAIALNPSAKKDGDRQLRDAVAQLKVLGMDLRGFDPYPTPQPKQPETKKSAITVKLNGGLYLTDKTKAAFENAVSRKDTLSLNTSASAPQAIPADAPDLPTQVTPPAATADPSILPGIQAIQRETLAVHSNYLDHDAEYTRLFGQLTQKELDLVSGNGRPVDLEQVNIALQTLDRSLAQFHQHQAETLRVHELYLNSQTELLNMLAGAAAHTGASAPFSTAMPQAPATVMKPAPAVLAAAEETPPALRPAVQPAVIAPAIDATALTAALLEIVSEKTGYPTEMLDLDMDMEADLGIDSIKRVEILGAMQDRFPTLPQADTSVLAETRTLGQIVDLLGSASTSSPSSQDLVMQLPSTVVTTTPIQTATAATGQTLPVLPVIQKALLEIVSEKTGYPTEMLDLGMDMEADLGIDSIKRVEILGAMQDRFPALSQADTSILAETRTLGKIIDMMASTDTAAAPASAAADSAAGTVSAQPTATQPVNAAPQDADPKDIQKVLLEIVSEKTGYPTEMLDLEMDMEADLGIDSIKRVEILGAMQERFPALPQADTSILAETRTLGQIVDLLGSASTPSPVSQDLDTQSPAAAEAAAPVHQKPGLARGVVALKALPLPDHIDFEPAEGRTALIVDDGSNLTIKLVEKLSVAGIKAAVVSLPKDLVQRKAQLPKDIAQVRVEDLSEEAIQTALAKAEKEFGPVGIFIHLDPASKGEAAFSEDEKAIVKTVFLFAKHLKDSLTQASENGYAAFITAVRLDGQFGLSKNGRVEPVSGGLFGLTKTLNLEWENVFCRAIDLHPDLDAQTAAGYIAGELADPNRLISEVAYNENGRYTLEVKLPESEALS